MHKLLIVFESDGLGRVPPIIRTVSDSAAATGASVRLRALVDARLRDLDWADQLALGIEARREERPLAVKTWVDRLGFSGWRAFRNKPGWVIPIAGHDLATLDALLVCRAVVDLLAARGMSPITAEHGEMLSAEQRTDAADPGDRLGTALGRVSQPAASEDADAGNRRMPALPSGAGPRPVLAAHHAVGRAAPRLS